MRPMGYFQCVVLAGVLLAAGACVQAPPPPPKPAASTVKKNYWLDGVTGKASIVIDLTGQRAYFYRDDKEQGESTISSGKKDFETPPGRYKVIQKDKDHISNLYGDYVDADGKVVQANVDATKDPVPDGAVFQGAKMPYFLRFRDGYGMHAGYVPRYRASHGCVRMPSAMAEHFFDAAELGTPVTVKEDPAPAQAVPSPAPAKQNTPAQKPAPVQAKPVPRK